MRGMYLLLVLILIVSCSHDYPECLGAWKGTVRIINETHHPIYVGSLSYFGGLYSHLHVYEISGNSIRDAQLMDSPDLYRENPQLQLVYNLRDIGFCLFSSELTNEQIDQFPTNSNWIPSGNYHMLHYSRYQEELTPGQQYIPPSLIYREQITTNETLPDGRYPWEVPTNTRPFYLVLASNTIVVTSVMTNVTN